MALNLGFWIAESVGGLFRHRLTAALTILGMSLTLWILGLLLLLWRNVEEYRDHLLEGLQIEVFLEPGLAPETETQIREQIALFDGIKEVRYVSPEEAAEIFAREFGGEIFAILEENPLPPSLKVALEPNRRGSQNAAEIAKKIERIPGADEVVFQGGLVELLETKFNALLKTLAAIGGLIFAATAAIFFQGVKLSLAARRDYVNALFLNGAKISAIKLPFVLEGAMTGLIAGAAAYGGVVLTHLILDRYFITLSYSGEMFLLTPAGIFLGLGGAIMAVDRNLEKFLLDKM